MTEATQDLEKFIHDLSTDASMQESFNNMLETTDASSIKQSIATYMQSAGYDIKDESIDALLREMKKSLEKTELTDESLDAVSGGYKSIQGIDVDNLIGIGTPNAPIRFSPGLVDALANKN